MSARRIGKCAQCGRDVGIRTARGVRVAYRHNYYGPETTHLGFVSGEVCPGAGQPVMAEGQGNR